MITLLTLSIDKLIWSLGLKQAICRRIYMIQPRLFALYTILKITKERALYKRYNNQFLLQLTIIYLIFTYIFVRSVFSC